MWIYHNIKGKQTAGRNCQYYHFPAVTFRFLVYFFYIGCISLGIVKPNTNVHVRVFISTYHALDIKLNKTFCSTICTKKSSPRLVIRNSDCRCLSNGKIPKIIQNCGKSKMLYVKCEL